MPDPGQGKRAHKKWWHENASNLDADIAAVNAIMKASSTATSNAKIAASALSALHSSTTTASFMSETAPNLSYTAALPTTATDTVKSTANTAAIDASNATHIDTATATSPLNDSTPDTDSFTYSHEEVQLLVEEAKLDRWQEGFDEGHKTGRNTGIKEGKEEGYNEGHGEGYEYGYDARRRIGEQREGEVCKAGRLEGYEAGMREGYDIGLKKGKENGRTKEEDEQTKKHGHGHCVPLGTWLQEGVQCDEGVQMTPEDATTADTDTQTDATTTVDIDTQTTPAATTTIDADMQTDDAAVIVIDMQTTTTAVAVDAEAQTDAVTTVVVDIKIKPTAPIVDASTQTVPTTEEIAPQTSGNPRENPPVPKSSAEGVEPPVPMQNVVPAACMDSTIQTDNTIITTVNTDTQKTSTSPTIVDTGTQTAPFIDEQPCLSTLLVTDIEPELHGSRSALLHDDSPEPSLSPAESVSEPHSPLLPLSPCAPSRLNWAEDAESLPIRSGGTVRDLSCLSTGCKRPFDSIRRQARRRQTWNPLPTAFVRCGRPVWTTGPIVTHRHPFGLGSGKPIVSIPSPVPQESPPKLDWDSDPRLVDLSRVLRALGWAPMC